MRRKLIVSALFGVLLACPSWGQDVKPKFKSIEVTHFFYAMDVAVEKLSPEFRHLLYVALMEELREAAVVEQIVGEIEVTEPSEADRDLILQGTVVKHSIAKDIGGRGLGAKFKERLRARVVLRRRSDNSSVFEKEIKVKASTIKKDRLKALASVLAKKIAREIKKALQ